MAISLSDNLAYSGSQSNFERDSYATLADMKSVKKTKMPNVMIAVCEETGKLYIYNKNNEADEELGLWREAGGEGGSPDSIPTLFANNGPELPIYSFTQGSKTSEEMLNLIGNNYYASYTGDYGRGNEPFIPGQVESRADSATVYIENAPKFGTQKCKLFAVNTVGEVFEGFFVTQNTTPTFTSDGLVWRKVENASGSETLTARDVEYIVQANMPTAVVYSKEVYDSMSGEELYKFLEAIYKNVYQKTNNFDNITAESLANNTKLEITEFTCIGHDELISPTVMDRITEYTLLIKDGTETKRIAAKGNLSREYTNTSVNSDSIKITAANPDFIETDTIDFSTWPEFTNPEANGIVLDGQGGANVDGSNVSVDPSDIEPDD
jgi:hypothetical protein